MLDEENEPRPAECTTDGGADAGDDDEARRGGSHADDLDPATIITIRTSSVGVSLSSSRRVRLSTLHVSQTLLTHMTPLGASRSASSASRWDPKLGKRALQRLAVERNAPFSEKLQPLRPFSVPFPNMD